MVSGLLILLELSPCLNDLVVVLVVANRDGIVHQVTDGSQKRVDDLMMLRRWAFILILLDLHEKRMKTHRFEVGLFLLAFHDLVGIGFLLSQKLVERFLGLQC